MSRQIMQEKLGSKTARMHFSSQSSASVGKIYDTNAPEYRRNDKPPHCLQGLKGIVAGLDTQYLPVWTVQRREGWYEVVSPETVRVWIREPFSPFQPGPHFATAGIKAIRDSCAIFQSPQTGSRLCNDTEG
jgi:hypothetical protein